VAQHRHSSQQQSQARADANTEKDRRDHKARSRLDGCAWQAAEKLIFLQQNGRRCDFGVRRALSPLWNRIR
jgi:hypothetical protein